MSILVMTAESKNSAGKQSVVPVANQKPDPCLEYHEKALKALRPAKWDAQVPQYRWSQAAIAYSLVYQNCRDLEKRRK